MDTQNLQPLSCKTATAWIHLLLDDALASEQNAQLLAHLQNCASCRALHRELTSLEAAFAAQDTRALAPPEDYFATLPEQVLARIAAAESPAPAQVFMRKRSAFSLRAFFEGRGRYAFAFAAMVMLVVVITQQLRERSNTAIIGKQTPQVSNEETAEPSVQSVEENSLATPSETREQTVRAVPHAPPRIASPMPHSKVELSESPASAESAPQPSALIASRSESERKTVAESYEDTLAAGEKAHAMQALQFVHNQQTEPPKVAIESFRQEAVARTPQTPSSFATKAQSGLRASTNLEIASKTEALAVKPEGATHDLQHVLARATHAQTEAERIKIWQQYLGYTPADSASYNAALENVAQRLAREVDSTATIAYLRDALNFYQTLAPTVTNRLGREDFEREKIRMQTLLKWKMSRMR